MSDKTIARRYARAIFDLALEQDRIEQVRSELRQVAQAIEDNAALKRMLKNQLVPTAAKKAVFSQAFGQLSNVTANFLKLVLDKRRGIHLMEIVSQFMVLADLSESIVHAEVCSAVFLSEEDLADLQQSLSTATGKTVCLQSRLEPELIGGMVVKLGDRVYDGSVQRRLSAMKDRLCRADFREIEVK